MNDDDEKRAEGVGAEAEALLDLVNTLDERSFTIHGVQHRGGDDLAELSNARVWLRKRGLLGARRTLATDDVVKLIELRRALRTALAVRAGHQQATAFAEVNEVLAGFPLAVQLRHDGTCSLAGTAAGIPAALGELLAQVVVDGGWTRIRMCAAPDCRWVFFDTSRNASGRWCSMRVCGNRDKTRRYRERQASA